MTDRHLLSGRTLRATESEWEAWLEDAQLRGLTFQEWARFRLNDAVDFRRPKPTGPKSSPNAEARETATGRFRAARQILKEAKLLP